MHLPVLVPHRTIFSVLHHWFGNFSCTVRCLINSIWNSASDLLAQIHQNSFINMTVCACHSLHNFFNGLLLLKSLSCKNARQGLCLINHLGLLFNLYKYFWPIMNTYHKKSFSVYVPKNMTWMILTCIFFQLCYYRSVFTLPEWRWRCLCTSWIDSQAAQAILTPIHQQMKKRNLLWSWQSPTSHSNGCTTFISTLTGQMLKLRANSVTCDVSCRQFQSSVFVW